MFYTVYKITNIVNGNIYIGAHRTSDLDDGYMGSGTLIQSALQKYGSESFTKEILFIGASSEEMFEKERELVFVGEGSYNMVPGGHGGWDFVNSDNFQNSTHTEEHRRMMLEKRSEKMESDPSFRELYKKNSSINGKKNGFGVRTEYAGSFRGKEHSEESKKAIGAKLKDMRQGSDNPMFGRVWIRNDILQQSKSINGTDLPSYEAEGWVRGRKTYGK